MENNRYFKEALASMAAGSAYVDAVRHMYDAGLSISQMQRQLTYPASYEMIEKAVRDYEAEKARGDSDYEYIQQTDKYGKRSFLRVKKEAGDGLDGNRE